MLGTATLQTLANLPPLATCLCRNECPAMPWHAAQPPAQPRPPNLQLTSRNACGGSMACVVMVSCTAGVTGMCRHGSVGQCSRGLRQAQHGSHASAHEGC